MAERLEKTAINLLSRISIDESTGCWDWQGYRRKGYGFMSVGSRLDQTKRQKPAHRLSYEIFVGNIPPGLMVCHKCDNPGCINPKHLFLGTNQDNVNDREQKGRNNHYFGESDPNAILTTRDVLDARKARTNGATFRGLAHQYGVHVNTITRAVKGATWAHLPLPEPPKEDDYA